MQWILITRELFSPHPWGSDTAASMLGGARGLQGSKAGASGRNPSKAQGLPIVRIRDITIINHIQYSCHKRLWVMFPLLLQFYLSINLGSAVAYGYLTTLGSNGGLGAAPNEWLFKFS